MNEEMRKELICGFLRSYQRWYNLNQSEKAEECKLKALELIEPDETLQDWLQRCI